MVSPERAATATATVQATSTPSVTVMLSNTTPTLTDTITATATPSNVDGDPVTLSYIWIDLNTDNVIQSLNNTSATTNMLNLAAIKGVSVGDYLYVIVTPASDGLTGSSATATAIVQAS